MTFARSIEEHNIVPYNVQQLSHKHSRTYLEQFQSSSRTQFYLSSWCLVMVELLFLAVPWGCLRFVIVVFPDHTHLL